jgi:hypothetical protein
MERRHALPGFKTERGYRVENVPSTCAHSGSGTDSPAASA